MAHFNDLASCTYFSNPDMGPLQAVGWLEAGHDYAKGDPGQAFFDQLRDLCADHWEPFLAMGFHACQFCRYSGFMSSENLFVPGEGTTYASPVAITHYLSAHGYCPPAEFVSAVMQCPAMNTPAYFEALHARGWSKQMVDFSRNKAYSDEFSRYKVAHSMGKALVVRIEAYQQINGTWPNSLAEAEGLGPDDASWHYERSGDGFSLWLDPRPDQLYRPMIWQSEFRRWQEYRAGIARSGSRQSPDMGIRPSAGS